MGCPNVQQLTLIDLAMATGGVELTSSAGGFTGSMVNCIFRVVSGSNFTPGVYIVKTYTDANTIELDRDATDGTGASAGRGTVGGPVVNLRATAVNQNVTVITDLDVHLRQY